MADKDSRRPHPEAKKAAAAAEKAAAAQKLAADREAAKAKADAVKAAAAAAKAAKVAATPVAKVAAAAPAAKPAAAKPEQVAAVDEEASTPRRPPAFRRRPLPRRPKPPPRRRADAAGPEFRWPARGRIIQGFKGGAGGNDGINIAVPEGTQVKAAEGGVVAYAGNELKGYGNLVLIRHPNGYVTAYANNGEIDVKRGETVKRGQMIAKSGQSGNVSLAPAPLRAAQGLDPGRSRRASSPGPEASRRDKAPAPRRRLRKAARPRDTVGRAIGGGGSNDRPAASRRSRDRMHCPAHPPLRRR